MSAGLKALQAVQFATVKGQRVAVLNAAAWDALVEWAETVEDRQIAQTALEELDQASGSRQRAGWLKWDEVEQELD